VLVKLSEQVEPTMKPSEALAAHRKEIREIVLAHRAVNARVFGSAVHGSDTDESDLDIFVDTTDLPPTSRTSIKFVKSVNQENDGHEEEQIYR
jgi:predicted nucleotidyltransferase